MRYEDFNMKEHGFVGHLAEPDHAGEKAVIVIMGGEKSILPGIKIAERFADYHITGLSVSLFGADGLPTGANQIPLDMFEKAIRYLKDEKKIKSISTYGMSMGSLFAALVAKYIGEVDNVILVSPSHVPFEGAWDKKHMTGQSMVTWRGKDLPFVKPDFSVKKSSKYYYDKEANRKVTGMWIAYRDAYRNTELEQIADIHIEELNARILMIAGTGDEAWPSDYSVSYLEKRLIKSHYPKDFKKLIYKNASHLIGMMPNKEKNKWLYRAIPIIGLIYKSFELHREDCMKALEMSEQEIIAWIS